MVDPENEKDEEKAGNGNIPGAVANAVGDICPNRMSSPQDYKDDISPNTFNDINPTSQPDGNAVNDVSPSSQIADSNSPTSQLDDKPVNDISFTSLHDDKPVDDIGSMSQPDDKPVEAVGLLSQSDDISLAVQPNDKPVDDMGPASESADRHVNDISLPSELSSKPVADGISLTSQVGDKPVNDIGLTSLGDNKPINEMDPASQPLDRPVNNISPTSLPKVMPVDDIFLKMPVDNISPTKSVNDISAKLQSEEVVHNKPVYDISPTSQLENVSSDKPVEDINTKKCRSSSSTRMILINPPSAFHPDIHPPSLVRVQRALRAHTKDGSYLLHQRSQKPPPASSFRDEHGHFILHGSSGGFYVGDVFGGLPHGLGQHYIPHPATGKKHMLYDGEWMHGTKTGSGTIFYTNGEEFKGELRNNQRWGHGWMKYKNDSFYCGDWLRGRRHGIGLHYWKNGHCYHGAFCKDSQDGWGIYYWPLENRKFEGEWVANQPYSGYYSQMDSGDFDFIGGMLLQYYPHSNLCPLFTRISLKARQMAEIKLQNPILTIFNVISAFRSSRAGDPDMKVLFKTQVGRKENLTASQLQILKKLFEVMVPMIDNKAQFHVTHLRRMLLLARIDPDIGLGEKLLAHLQSHTLGKTSVGFDEILQYILQFHHP